jgi:uncharacterized protein (TIGR02679 family)
VCLDGVPSTAAFALLGQLGAGGARVRFRADFDWAGIRIGNLVAGQVPGAMPWRFSADDYRRALGAAHGSIALGGEPIAAGWDASLAAAMAGAGRAIYEEQLFHHLIADLDSS